MRVLSTPYGLLAVDEVHNLVQKTRSFADTYLAKDALFRFLNESGYKLVNGYYM